MLHSLTRTKDYIHFPSRRARFPCDGDSDCDSLFHANFQGVKVSVINHTFHLNNIHKYSSYMKENTTRLHYKDQLVNVLGNDRCLI
jgi:hypothetical protein